MSDVTRVEAIYLAAIERADPIEQAAYLESACGADAELRRKVDELLAAHPKVGQFLELNTNRTHDHTPGVDAEPLAAVGDRVGPYKLLEKVGEGGMGEVWVADQLEPIKRRVALKLIKPGMDSRSVLARFEAERQALAVMDHPNIAKVLDAGTTTDGRPYFVMELVKGTPITEFCDARKLSPKERLELFIPVCQAIQHAHMKGIIHRDIKPSNVMVELHDDRAVPKVIDFGVAKAIGQQLTEKTIYTGFGALVGTPAYMAPEQATFNALDVDTRADIYALGVLLYELLAGSPPIEAERMKKAAIDEVLRIVRDEEPPRPSQRLSTSHSKASIAATRQSDPAKLSALMKGEIDWIVMKALEKDRTRRYDTANGLAKDIQRYLSGDSVEACPPTLGYRLKKAYRKNKAQLWVGAIVGAALMLGVVGLIEGYFRAKRAEVVARSKEQEAQEQRKQAELNKEAWLNTSEAYWEAAVEAEIRAASARLDADLLEYKSDPRVGLLLLARPLKESVTIPIVGPNNGRGTVQMAFSNHDELVKLREFQAAAVIAAGQEFVPLVPPLEASGRLETSRDGRLLLTGLERSGIELMAIPSLKRIGVLREGSERLTQWGFSPDSKTIWTQDTDSLVRFWNIDGTFRAKTPLRHERFVYPAGMTIEEVRNVADRGNALLVADGVAVVRSLPSVLGKPGKETDDWNGFQKQVPGPTDLYSTGTGQFIRRLDRPGWTLSEFRLVAGDRWLTHQNEKFDAATRRREIELVIVSAVHGRELARLDHPGPESFLSVNVSPTGKWIVSKRHNGSGERDQVSRNVLLWRSHDWKQVTDAAFAEAIAAVKSDPYMTFISDDLLDVRGAELGGLLRIGQPGSWTPKTALVNQATFYDEYAVPELGGKLLRVGRDLSDGNTFQRLKPLPGRRYAAELAKIAPDGRFFENLDTVAEKELPTIAQGNFVPGVQGHFTPGIGRIAVRTFGGEPGAFTDLVDPYLHILPDPKRLDIPPAMLEFWAQVVTGGELGSDGRFVQWDLPTWSAKQKQLAAMKPPYADFPFPGWVTQEPNLWWRIRANQLNAGKERDKLMEEWQHRSGRTRPNLGPDTWRTPEVAPKAEPKK